MQRATVQLFRDVIIGPGDVTALEGNIQTWLDSNAGNIDRIDNISAGRNLTAVTVSIAYRVKGDPGDPGLGAAPKIKLFTGLNTAGGIVTLNTDIQTWLDSNQGVTDLLPGRIASAGGLRLIFGFIYLD